jgi:GT2 family glycosyltransferase
MTGRSSLNRRDLVSIILLTHNGLKLTEDCIDSIYRFSIPSFFELIIIDNASSDATPRYLSRIARQKENIKVIYNKKNLGFARACNQGASFARGYYLLFLNNDTSVTQGWLREMLKVFKEEKKVGVVGSRLIYPDGGLQHGGMVLTLWGLPINLDKGSSPENSEELKAREVFSVTGASMLIRRDLFFDCEGFDERYIYGYEDVDLCLKISQMGYGVFYTPKSLIYHYASATFSKDRYIESEFRDETIFRSKWGEVLGPMVKDYLVKLKEKGIGKILIYGTGRAGKLLHSVLLENGFEVFGFMDSAEEKWGKSFLDKRIFSFDEAKALEYDAIIIGSQFIVQIRDALEENGIKEKIIVPIIF